jgi:two-component system chemotaxis response regulator CheY
LAGFTPRATVTTEGRAQDRERGLQLGASEYLIKPFESETLTALVQRYLTR